MGIWGAKLYQDDLALDIKEEYIGKLERGLDNQKALEEVIKENEESLEDDVEKTVFWLALADTMWKVGRLTQEVKQKALQIINKEENLKIWKEQGSKREYEIRKEELNKLREKLNSPMPKEKQLCKKEKKLSSNRQKSKWNIGDTYAYQLKSEKAKELGLYKRYLIFRKIADSEIYPKSIAGIVYIQITKTEQLPQNEEEINRLEYIIMSNMGNVRHKYRTTMKRITQKCMKEEMIYVGNYLEVKMPEDEYIEEQEINMSLCGWEQVTPYIIEKVIRLGTNKKPVYYEVDPKNISDSHVRFLMRVRHYEKVLKIIPPEGAIVKDDPLLYIALIDSMMIGGFVKNPVGGVGETVKQEAYRRIEELRNIINKRTEKEEQLQVLNELEDKIRKFNSGL